MIKRSFQFITQPFSSGHKGVDLRCVDDETMKKNLPVIAPEKIKLLRQGKDGYGNYFIVCQPMESEYGELKFIHIDKTDYPKYKEFDAGDEVSFCILGGNSTSLHLHFEVWKDGKSIDPVEYFHDRKIKYEFKK